MTVAHAGHDDACPAGVRPRCWWLLSVALAVLLVAGAVIAVAAAVRPDLLPELPSPPLRAAIGVAGFLVGACVGVPLVLLAARRHQARRTSLSTACVRGRGE